MLGRMWKRGLVLSVAPVKKNKNSENMVCSGTSRLSLRIVKGGE